LAYWANGLVLAQVLDGGAATFSVGNVQLDLLAGVTPVRTVDIDSSRPNFDHNTRRGFYGGQLSAQLGPHRPFIYYLAQRDYNDDDFAVFGENTPTRFKYNSNYLGFGSRGALGDRLLYGVEVAFEGGWGLSNSYDVFPTAVVVPGEGVIIVDRPQPVQQRDQWIRAYAADARLDYLLGDARRTRFSAELVLASGDPDRFSTTDTLGGNRRGTDDHAFNAFGLINTGLAFAPPVSNLLAARAGVSTFPFTLGDPWKRLQVGGDFFVFAKYRTDSPIDEPTTDSRYLGVEPDLFLNWQLTNDLTLAVRYGVFFPGSALVADDVRQFVFIGVTYAF
jgi:hypothetical protein